MVTGPPFVVVTVPSAIVPAAEVFSTKPPTAFKSKVPVRLILPATAVELPVVIEAAVILIPVAVKEAELAVKAIAPRRPPKPTPLEKITSPVLEIVRAFPVAESIAERKSTSLPANDVVIEKSLFNVRRLTSESIAKSPEPTITEIPTPTPLPTVIVVFEVVDSIKVEPD